MKAPGSSPGLSYARPWAAVAVASAGLAIAALLLVIWTAYRVQLRNAAPWSLAVADIAIAAAPLMGAVVVAALLSRTSMLRTTGIDRWTWADALLGLAIAAVARAVVELLAPTEGRLSGPFDVVDRGVGFGLATAVIGAMFISPVVEELFFRGLVQRALADAMSRFGPVAASVFAVPASTVAFMGLHLAASAGPVSLGVVVGTVGVGLGCGIATAATGRLAAALVAHAAFNASGVFLLVT